MFIGYPHKEIELNDLVQGAVEGVQSSHQWPLQKQKTHIVRSFTMNTPTSASPRVAIVGRCRPS